MTVGIGVVEVMIQMSPHVGQDERAQPSQLVELRRMLKGYRVEPLHPGSTDPALSSYYRVHVPDAQSASKVIEAVRALPSVTAAYVKPEDEPP